MIKAAEPDLYLAMVDEKVIMKIGPKLVPSGFALIRNTQKRKKVIECISSFLVKVSW